MGHDGRTWLRFGGIFDRVEEQVFYSNVGIRFGAEEMTMGSLEGLQSKSMELIGTRFTRRRFAVFAGSSAAISILAACGNSKSTPTTASSASTATTSSSTATSTATTSGGGGASTPTAASTAAATSTETAAATATTASAGTPKQGGTLTFATNIDAKTLDPHFSAQFSEKYMLYLIYNNVIGYDSKFNLVPELATKWDVSSDGKQITLHLKDGMKFHDGTDCDAAAVKWSLERVLDPQVNSPQAGSLAAIDTIDAPDNTTVVLNLKDAGRPVLSNLGQRPGFVVPKSAVDKEGQDFGQKPVGSGPFKFVEWVPDSHITVERFDGYWDTSKPYLDKITMTHVPEGQVQATQLRTGEADIIDAVSAPLVQVLKGAQNVVIEENESGRFIAVTWDVSKPPFDNKDLRVALAYGTDREEVKKVIYSGTGRVATHPIGIGWAYDASLDNTYYTYDADKAKEYIDKAGVAGQSFTITVGNTQSNLAFVQLLQSQYEKLGIKIEIKTVNAADAYAMVKAGQIDWTNKSWSPRSIPTPGCVSFTTRRGSRTRQTTRTRILTSFWMKPPRSMTRPRRLPCITRLRK